MKLFFYREGNFSYPDATHSTVAYVPETLAEQMGNDMQAWLKWQLEIYAEPLDQFKNYLKKKEIVLNEVKQDGYALQYADECFKKDKDVVLAAIKQRGRRSNMLMKVSKKTKSSS